jgi:hypothetical protein
VFFGLDPGKNARVHRRRGVLDELYWIGLGCVLIVLATVVFGGVDVADLVAGDSGPVVAPAVVAPRVAEVKGSVSPPRPPRRCGRGSSRSARDRLWPPTRSSSPQWEETAGFRFGVARLRATCSSKACSREAGAHASAASGSSFA